MNTVSSVQRNLGSVNALCGVRKQDSSEDWSLALVLRAMRMVLHAALMVTWVQLAISLTQSKGRAQMMLMHTLAVSVA